MRNISGFHFDAKRKVAHFEVTLPGTNGRKRRRKTIEVEDRDQAFDKWKEFRDEVLSPITKPETRPDPLTFREYVERFQSLIEARLAKGTVELERGVLTRNLLPFFGSYRLDRINRALVNDFVGELRRQGHAPAHVNRIVGVLRKYL